MTPTVGTFRDVMSRFPSGVVIVTTRADDDDYAITASSFTSVSLDPLLVLVCIAQDTRFHQALTKSGSWAVNVLPEDGGAHADWFAQHGRPMTRDVSRPNVRRSETSGMLVLEEAVAHLECRTRQIHLAGDHDIVVGDVISARVVSQALPLVYWRSAYHEGLAPTEPWPPRSRQRASSTS